MVFTKRLREGVRRGNRYQMDGGSIVVDSIAPIKIADITYDLATCCRSPGTAKGARRT